ncbi:hypothetical protein [Candidatus Neptunochlamydia vexilliferae]|uniref:DUF3108 domain-containing protein n=1 Tax=Candidatus Neptunichlamydia vexilliferae TaxID=1651774 RepID=A0ABS0AZD0_9BACT|nr:hypothetical protein [Candidatus Neptunochlamydia vexilliferae]MBF5058690.1 hypothetical protein [Candidatus Neptunochlamydia vexilliferae]
MLYTENMKIIVFLLVCSSLFAEVTYIYNKDLEGRTSKTTWTLDLKKSDDMLHIIGESLTGQTKIIATPERVTQCFTYAIKNQSNTYTVLRDGAHLIATQEVNGEKSVREFHIGNNAWVQEFDFCFKPFIHSDNRSFTFSIVHPKKMSLHNMVATKQRYETLEIHGKTYEALRVKLTLTGFKKMFWHADLWFDPQAGDLLKYMANEGPNTPLSTITLFSKQIN